MKAYGFSQELNYSSKEMKNKKRFTCTYLVINVKKVLKCARLIYLKPWKLIWAIKSLAILFKDQKDVCQLFRRPICGWLAKWLKAESDSTMAKWFFYEKYFKGLKYCLQVCTLFWDLWLLHEAYTILFCKIIRTLKPFNTFSIFAYYKYKDFHFSFSLLLVPF